MENDDLTIRVLTEIRDEIKQTNQRVDELSGRVGHLETHLGARIDETNRRLVESEVRLSTAIVGMAGTLDDVKQLLVQRNTIDDRVTRCEREIDDLKRRVS